MSTKHTETQTQTKTDTVRQTETQSDRQIHAHTHALHFYILNKTDINHCSEQAIQQIKHI